MTTRNAPIWNKHCLVVVACLGMSAAVSAGPSPNSELKASELHGQVLTMRGPFADTSTEEETTGTLPATQSGKGHLSYRAHAHHGQPGQILDITLTRAQVGTYLLVTTADEKRQQILDSRQSSAARQAMQLSLELPEAGNVLIVVASESKAPTNYSLRVSVEDPPLYERHGDPDQTYALIVAIQDYPRESMDLRGPHQDAELMLAALSERFGIDKANIVVLKDDDATRRRIVDAWLGHLAQAGPNGAALFYYSGHGIQVSQRVGQDIEGDGLDEALLLADGSVLVDDELGQLADRLSAGHKYVILDSCYSGTGTRARDGVAKRVALERLDFALHQSETTFGGGQTKGLPEPEPRTHLLLAAAAENEVAYISRTSPGPRANGPVSVFTYFLSEEMSALAPGGSLEDLMANVRRKTLAYVRQSFGDNQSPHVEGEGDLTRFLAP